MSTEVTDEHPLEKNSYEIFTLQAKRSKTHLLSSIYLFCNILKRLSFALSVVGRTSKLFGICIFLPL